MCLQLRIILDTLAPDQIVDKKQEKVYIKLRKLSNEKILKISIFHTYLFIYFIKVSCPYL